MQTADAQWKAGEVDAAVKILDKVAGAGGPLAPLDIPRRRKNPHRCWQPARRGAHLRSDARALPDYGVSDQACDVKSLFRNQDVCSGDASIAARLQAVRGLLEVRATLELRIADTTRPALERASSAIQLAEAWMAKTTIDPGPNPETTKLYSVAAQRLYERAIQLAAVRARRRCRVETDRVLRT